MLQLRILRYASEELKLIFWGIALKKIRAKFVWFATLALGYELVSLGYIFLCPLNAVATTTNPVYPAVTVFTADSTDILPRVFVPPL